MTFQKLFGSSRCLQPVPRVPESISAEVGQTWAKLLTLARHVAIIVAENDCKPVTLTRVIDLSKGANASKLKANGRKVAGSERSPDSGPCSCHRGAMRLRSKLSSIVMNVSFPRQLIYLPVPNRVDAKRLDACSFDRLTGFLCLSRSRWLQLLCSSNWPKYHIRWTQLAARAGGKSLLYRSGEVHWFSRWICHLILFW